jgi:hypothetical protein
LFISRPTSKPQRDKTAHILSEIQKISLEDAMVLAEKMIIPVAKGVSQATAEDYRQKFAGTGIPVRMTKQ